MCFFFFCIREISAGFQLWGKPQRTQQGLTNAEGNINKTSDYLRPGKEKYYTHAPVHQVCTFLIILSFLPEVLVRCDSSLRAHYCLIKGNSFNHASREDKLSFPRHCYGQGRDLWKCYVQVQKQATIAKRVLKWSFVSYQTSHTVLRRKKIKILTGHCAGEPWRIILRHRRTRSDRFLTDGLCIIFRASLLLQQREIWHRSKMMRWRRLKLALHTRWKIKRTVWSPITTFHASIPFFFFFGMR